MEAVPDARHIAILAEWNYTSPAELQALQNATRARGLEVAVFYSRSVRTDRANDGQS
jgi:hypothetical protein